MTDFSRRQRLRRFFPNSFITPKDNESARAAHMKARLYERERVIPLVVLRFRAR